MSKGLTLFLTSVALFSLTAPAPASAQLVGVINNLGTGLGSTQFAYVTNGSSNNVSGFTLNPSTGALTPIFGSPFTSGKSGPASAAADPAGRFLYVANPSSRDNDVAGFYIDSFTGALTPIPGSPFKAGTGPTSVAVHPSGNFVYIANFGSGNLSAFRINATGTLTPVPGSPFPTGSSPSFVTVDPAGKFVYVTNEASNNISGYTVNTATGALTPVSGSPFATGTSPVSVAIDPLDRFAYVANAGSSDISGYLLSTAGALTPVYNSPIPAGSGGVFSLAINPTTTSFYEANSVYAAGSGGLFAYDISPSFFIDFPPPAHNTIGDLSAFTGSPFAAGSPPSFAAVDYTGTFLYVANQGSANISAYKVAGNSVPAPLAGSPFATGSGPDAIVLVRPKTIPVFSATQIPDPSNGFAAYLGLTPAAINNKGAVTGTVTGFAPQSFETHSAFLYSGGITLDFGGTGFVTAGEGINDSGQAVGSASVPLPNGPAGAFLPQAILYSNGAVTNLDNRPGGDSVAFGINNAGQITGSRSTGVCLTPFGCSTGDTHAFLDAGSGLTDLPTLGGNFTEGLGINNQGEITGAGNLTTNGPNHAFLYSGGKIHDLGTLGGNATWGTAINDAGVIIGYSALATGQPVAGFQYSQGAFHSFATLSGGTYSQPLGINSEGFVVGTSNGASGGPNHAFLYLTGSIVDLNALVDPSLPLLTSAAGINSLGQIVATGLNGKVYVLTPQ